MRTPVEMSSIYQEKLENILTEICQIFDEDLHIVKSRSRKTEHVRLRHLYCYVACNVLQYKVPLRLIGHFVGRHDHTTVIHAREVVRKDILNPGSWYHEMWRDYTEKSTIWKNYLAA